MAICDDDQQARRSFEAVIRGQWKDGCTILHFESGQDLGNHYREKKKPIDIILLDIYMRQINGIETAKLIRKMDEDAIIILLTSSLNHTLAGYEVHAFGYLVKPVKSDRLISTIHEALTKVIRSEETITIKGKPLLKLLLRTGRHERMQHASLCTQCTESGQNPRE